MMRVFIHCGAYIHPTYAGEDKGRTLYTARNAKLRASLRIKTGRLDDVSTIPTSSRNDTSAHRRTPQPT
jgi:hypothetical protein